MVKGVDVYSQILLICPTEIYAPFCTKNIQFVTSVLDLFRLCTDIKYTILNLCCIIIQFGYEYNGNFNPHSNGFASILG